MRSVGLLLGLVVAGAAAAGASALAPGPDPTLVTAGAGLLGSGIVGLAVLGIDRAVERRRIAAPFGRGRADGLSNADRLAVALGSAAVFVRVGLLHVVADPLRIDGAVLTALAVSTIGVALGYRTASSRLDGLRHGALACGLGGALCVSLAAYDAEKVGSGAFDALVAGSGVVLPVSFGLFGGLSGVAGWWLADWLSGADPLA
ncbi:hypothetical protein M0R89_09405 [Halorussus limi]|uniref:Uncharacterized protein n=1 Tax=Halorussus limi TaxID=2938695 RepID=A0A8U0HP12_9EURY|nr:hypothetical protein [Halorussus limi]UPV72765.1 hypothetical protein M0R89_09405 [Halorussus limi]